jgi:hypothetical protein
MGAVTEETINTSQEDAILIAMITSTEFLKGIIPIYNADYVEGSYTKTVADWCIEHYAEFKKAPGVHIQDIFDRRVREGLAPATADIIEQFLTRLSSSHEKERAHALDVEFAISEAVEYFKFRSVSLLYSDIGYGLDQKESVDSIVQRVGDFVATDFDTTTTSFSESMKSSTNLLNERIKVPRAFLWPWLREGSLNLIYAARGIGKSWLALMIAVSLTREKYQDIEIGPWVVKHPGGVLYMDGEMGFFDMQDRIRQIVGPLGPESRKFPLLVFSSPDYVEKYKKAVNLMKPEWQERIIDFLNANKRIKVLILDNLSSLTAGRDENDNQLTSMLSNWIVRLRAIGITVIIVHHAGKSGDQRGASSLEDALNNTIKLKKPKDTEGGGAHFVITFTKSRNDPGGEGYRSFAIKLMEHDESSRWRIWVQV